MTTKVTIHCETLPKAAVGGIILGPPGQPPQAAVTVTPGTPVAGVQVSGIYVLNALGCNPSSSNLDVGRGISTVAIPAGLVTDAEGNATFTAEAHPCAIVGQAVKEGYATSNVLYHSMSLLPSAEIPGDLVVTVYMYPPLVAGAGPFPAPTVVL